MTRDFIIPVVVQAGAKTAKVERFGPLSGEWTEKEEEAASKVMSYILIDAQGMTDFEIRKAEEMSSH